MAFRLLTRPLQRFFSHEASGGALLLGAAVLALILANSPFSAEFAHLQHTTLAGKLTVETFVNDGLMAVFFFVVGLEVKRELVSGELRTFRRALLPAIAALGGMLGPALVFAAFNHGTTAEHGWGVPTATDIAFVIGALSLLKGRVPQGLAVFIVALAVFDDIGGVLLIAVFYGGGIHPSILGVVLAVLVPMRFLQRIVDRLHPLQVYLIMPIFALFNAGVDLRSLPDGALHHPAVLGVGLGLFLGKQLGIFATTAAAVKLRLAPLPSGATWGSLYGVSILGGIGFTVALFIANLAFADAAILSLAKAGVLAGSLVSGIGGYVWLSSRRVTKDTTIA